MFDFLRNITKPVEEKRQERLNAYLDGALSTQERRRFEKELANDAELRADLERLQWVKMSVEKLPRVRAPRNFVLDPALYGQPVKRQETWSLYPSLRVATALTAFFFILALALDLATPTGALNQPLLGGASQTAMEESQRQADDVAMMAEPEVSSAPAEEPAPADGAELVAPFATGEGEVGAAADEAANEIAEEEALLEEEMEEPAAEAPDSVESTGPAAGAAEDSTERFIEATVTAQEEEISALAPPETLTRESEAEALEATQDSYAGPEASDGDAADATQTPVEPEQPFPYLLAIEVVLGAALLALAIATLIAGRSG